MRGRTATVRPRPKLASYGAPMAKIEPTVVTPANTEPPVAFSPTIVAAAPAAEAAAPAVSYTHLDVYKRQFSGSPSIFREKT